MAESEMEELNIVIDGISNKTYSMLLESLSVKETGGTGTCKITSGHSGQSTGSNRTPSTIHHATASRTHLPISQGYGGPGISFHPSSSGEVE